MTRNWQDFRFNPTPHLRPLSEPAPAGVHHLTSQNCIAHYDPRWPWTPPTSPPIYETFTNAHYTGWYRLLGQAVIGTIIIATFRARRGAVLP